VESTLHHGGAQYATPADALKAAEAYMAGGNKESCRPDSLADTATKGGSHHAGRFLFSTAVINVPLFKATQSEPTIKELLRNGNICAREARSVWRFYLCQHGQGNLDGAQSGAHDFEA
jgi:hypothetical protein